MNYQYFQNPHLYSSFEKDKECSICNNKGAYDHYNGAYCDDCISTGKCDDIEDGVFNETEIIKDLSGLTKDEWKAKDSIVSKRTPPLQKWQEWEWPACCTDYQTYLCELSKEKIGEYAKDLSPINYIKQCLKENMDANDVFEGLREPDKSTDSRDYPMGLYLFECQICNKQTMKWDAN
jgi:uncharacterized protein CbrC (UPF0167 family)